MCSLQYHSTEIGHPPKGYRFAIAEIAKLRKTDRESLLNRSISSRKEAVFLANTKQSHISMQLCFQTAGSDKLLRTIGGLTLFLLSVQFDYRIYKVLPDLIGNPDFIQILRRL